MQSIIEILAILFLYSFFSFAQNSDDTKKIITIDSLEIKANPLTQLQIKFDEFDLRREFNSLKTNLSLDGDPQTVWLRTSIAISNTDNSNQKFAPHFLSPLQKKYYEDSKFDPIRSILGMAQAGAVGYLAYKHIKKYGFFK